MALWLPDGVIQCVELAKSAVQECDSGDVEEEL
jgi:hypothetical protein